MTKVDIKNYLEQIYKIPVVNVMTFNKLGHISVAAPSSKNAAPPMPDHIRKGQRLNKEEDDKIAQVSFIKRVTLRPHLSKRPSDLKQNGAQETTPLSGTVFHILPHGVFLFVVSVSFKNHLI